jgi:hypothetical protein
MASNTVHVDLDSLGTTIDSADGLSFAKKFENAVQAYQAAAGQGLNIAAEIGTDTPQVHQAIAIANQILALDWHLASEATVIQAQNLARQMQSQLQQAFSAAPVSVVIPEPTPVVQPVAPTSNNNTLWIAAGGLALVGAGGFLWWYLSHRPKENPSGSRRSTPGAKRALIAKGNRSSAFEMVDGPDVTVRGGMMHDPSGRWWPKRSVLFGPFRANLRDATDEEFDGPAKDYLGRGHNAKIGTVDTPPKDLASWKYIGDVEKIYYTRTGRKKPGRYVHEFNKRMALATLVKGRGRVRLYRRGRYVRLELPKGAMLDSRGYVWP